MIPGLTFVTAMALLLQGAPASQTVARGSISGVVVHSGTGDPVAGVRVTVAKTDLPASTEALLEQLAAGQDGPPVEMALPVEFFEAMKAQMTLGFDPDGRRREDPDLPPEAALFNALPLDKAHSILISPNGKVGIVPKNAPPLMTDGGGRFTFNNLEPGAYRLIFAANGFVRQDYGQALANAAGTPVVLQAGQAASGLVMRVTPTGAISGRVLDNSGQPVAAAPVQLARLEYDAKAKKTARTIASTQTDDRGEYRFYFLTPGRYYLSGGGKSQSDFPFAGVTGGVTGGIDIDDVSVSDGPPPDFGPFGSVFGTPSPTANRVAQNYSVSFYRGAPDVGSATPIDIAPGADMPDIDLTVATERVYTVRGWIVDAVSGKPPANAFISMSSSETSPSDLGVAAFDGFFPEGQGNQRYNPDDGTFELRNVRPGSYLLTANLPDWNPGNFPEPDEKLLRTMSPAESQKYFEAMEAAAMAAEAERPMAMATITVGNADVDSVMMRVAKGVSVTGRVRVENVSGRGPALNRVRVGLTAASGPFGRGQLQPLIPDGVFHIDGLAPGEYLLNINGLPAGFYLKSARLGDWDALNGPVTLSAEKTANLEITIASGVGQIEGTVTGSDGRPAAGAQVVLIPDRNRIRTELFKPVTAGTNGRFSILNVTPGDYHIVSWEFLEPYGFFDPAMIRQAEEKGKAVRVGESSKQTVDVRTIGAP